MEYTKNYHLPQWAETDRILRTDFNQMCKDTEDGLTGVASDIKTGLAKVSSDLNAGLAGVSADLEAGLAEQAGETGKSWDALLRFSRLRLAKSMDTFDRSAIYSVNGTFLNPLRDAAMADRLTGTKWHKTLGVYAGRGEVMDPAILRSGCTELTAGLTSQDASSSYAVSTYSFVSPVSGEVRSFICYLFIFMTSNSPELMLDLTFTVEKKSGTKYTNIYQKDFLIERTGTKTLREEVPVDVFFAIEKGTEYRLKLRPKAIKKILGRYGFSVNMVADGDLEQGYVDESKFTVQNPFQPSASHTRSFPTEGPASRALAVIRYRKDEAASTMTPTINGLSMTRLSDTVLEDGDGGTYREAWFLRVGNFNGTATLKIAMAAAGNDDMRLLEYGVMLL